MAEYSASTSILSAGRGVATTSGALAAVGLGLDLRLSVRPFGAFDLALLLAVGWLSRAKMLGFPGVDGTCDRLPLATADESREVAMDGELPADIVWVEVVVSEETPSEDCDAEDEHRDKGVCKSSFRPSEKQARFSSTRFSGDILRHICKSTSSSIKSRTASSAVQPSGRGVFGVATS